VPDDDEQTSHAAEAMSGYAAGDALGTLLGAGPIGVAVAIAALPAAWAITRLVRAVRRSA
jgi:hypothetical protein